MSGGKKHANPLLVILTIFLCLTSGVFLDQSSSDMASYSGTVYTGTADAQQKKDSPSSSTQGKKDSTTSQNKKPSDKTTSDDGPYISPEAYEGEWVPVGDNWCFEVNDTPITGWFYDTDSHIYYFNTKGIMLTGWLNHNGKRYYFDEDGIMQTGKVPIDGKVYLFADNGTMEGYAEPTPTPVPEQPEETQFPAQAVPNPDGSKPSIALTFDDGPGQYADRILDCLEANHAKATFFMLGELIPYFPEQVKRMEALGCELGNHTYHHANLTKLTAEEITSEIEDTNAELEKLVGHGATVLRPPYGAFNDFVAASTDTPMILWSIDTLDWETRDADQTIQTTLENVRDGSIILMHEIHKESADAAEILIPMLIEAGYDLVTVHELAERHNVTLSSGIPYGEISFE